MQFFHIAILALVQGIAEFLPISSSGHLILAHNLLSPDAMAQAQNNRLMDIAVHIGSLLAVLVYFHRDVFLMFCGLKDTAIGKDTPNRNLFLLVLIGSVPIIVIGGLVYKLMDPSIFYNPQIIAFTAIFFGALLWLSDRKADHRPIETMSFKDAAIIGLSQCLALIPGTSRSGITMTASRFLGFSRIEAARYSLLLSILATSAVGAAGILDIIQEGNDGLISDAILAASLTFVTALGVIAFLMAWLKRFGFLPFVIYRFILGAVIFYFYVLPKM